MHCLGGESAVGLDAKSDATGFMIGGHGMSGCSQYGFTLIDSTLNNGSAMSVSYVEERTPTADNFDEILECVRAVGASKCTHLAQRWL